MEGTIRAALSRQVGNKRFLPGLAVIAAVLLTAAGCALLYSATGQADAARYGNSLYTVYQQLVQASVGFGILALLALVPMSRLRRLAPWGIAGGLVLALLPFVPALGIRSGGAVRHFALGALRWEPGQVLVLTLLVWTASVLAKRPLGRKRRFQSVGVVAAGLIISVMQPDFSLLPLILVPVAVQAWLAGVRGRRALHLVVGVTAVIVGAAVVNPYIARRVDGWMRPQATVHEAGRDYVLLQRGVASAGVMGSGYGKGRYVVRTGEAKSDYMYAHAVEELGFLRAFGLLFLY
ncbi:MAG: FtsW/RodA/SpoVE family cell cycle protein, partial [Rhodopirellula sp. JB053]